MSVVDTAIARLQDLVQSCTDTVVKSAPDYPIEDATSLPLAITHITNGTGVKNEYTTVQLIVNLSVDVHFARVNLKDCYQRIDKFIPEFLCRLGGDSTLNGAIDTINWPVSFTVAPAQWDAITTQMVSFTVPIKTLETPITTT